MRPHRLFKRCILLACMLLSLVSYGAAQSTPAQPASAIWGDVISPTEFDEHPFREVNVIPWVNDITRYVYSITRMENYDAAAAMGAQAGELAVGDAFAVFWDSKLLPRDPKVAPDLVDNQIAAYKKAGIRVIGAIPTCLQAQIWRDHPDWRQQLVNSTDVPEVDYDKQPWGDWLCQMGPWGDYCIDVLEECLRRYPDIDAFGYDGIHHFNGCYCQHCRADWLRDTGLEMPAKEDMNDPTFRRFQVWMDRRMERFVEKMQTRLRAIKSDVAIISWTTNAGRFGHMKELPRSMPTRMNLLFDAPCQEYWLDETNRGMSVVPAFAAAYIWTVSNHRQAFCEPYLMSHGNPYGTDAFPPLETMFRAMQVITQGSQLGLALMFNQRVRPEAPAVLKAVGEREPWLTHKQPEPWGAIVMSDTTRIFYGKQSEEIEKRYLAHVFGAFRVGMEEHLPLTVINDWNLNDADLVPYKVLVLPNTACLSTTQSEAVRRFVAQGGGLVATLDTSTMDETGADLGRFQLADVFGAEWAGQVDAGESIDERLDINFLHGVGPDYFAQRKGIFDLAYQAEHPIFAQPKITEYIAGFPVTFKGKVAAITLPTTGGAQVISNVTARLGQQQTVPAVTVHSYGKGKVVFLPAGLDAGYYLYPYPYERLILAEAMRWAAPEPPRIQVEAPMSVQTTFFRQIKAGERLVVHVYNNLNSTGAHALPDFDVPLREEIIPIHGIKLKFNGYPIKRIHLEPGNVELPLERDAEGNPSVTLPPLEIHAMVVAEL